MGLMISYLFYSTPIRNREGSMSSAKQFEANRANARKSTGPKTDQGKGRSRLNSTKHGLTAQFVVLEGEDPADFEQLLRDLEAQFEPASTLEHFLLGRIAAASWRLQRIPIFEAAIIETRRAEIIATTKPPVSNDFRDDPNRLRWLQDMMPKAKPGDQKSGQTSAPKKESAPEAKPPRDPDELAEEKRISEQKTLGMTLILDSKHGDTLGKLSRYETSLFNAFERNVRHFLLVRDIRLSGDRSREIVSTISATAN
jgi:hypothetical protein